MIRCQTLFIIRAQLNAANPRGKCALHSSHICSSTCDFDLVISALKLQNSSRRLWDEIEYWCCLWMRFPPTLVLVSGTKKVEIHWSTSSIDGFHTKSISISSIPLEYSYLLFYYCSVVFGKQFSRYDVLFAYQRTFLHIKEGGKEISGVCGSTQNKTCGR